MAPKPVAYASLEEILAADDLQPSDLQVPEWNGMTVKVRGLRRRELTAVYQGVKGENGQETVPEPDVVNARILSLGLVQPQVSEQQAMDMLNEKAVKPTQKILERIVELSGLGDEFRQATEDSVRAA